MANTYHIPAGPKNLASLFPSINFDDVKSYTVQAAADSTVIASSPLYTNTCYNEDFIILHFLNNLGAYETLIFFKPHVVHDDTADEYQNALNYPLAKTDTGTERFNVRSNDTYEAKRNCTEDEMPFIRECNDAPKIFMQWKGIEGQADDFIPVIKVAGSFDRLKNVEEFRYEYVIKFKLSNGYFGLRN